MYVLCVHIQYNTSNINWYIERLPHKKKTCLTCVLIFYIINGYLEVVAV